MRRAPSTGEGARADGREPTGGGMSLDTDGAFTVEVRGLGATRRAPALAGASLLESLLGADLPVPHMCREARCGRCRTTVVEGGDLLVSPGEREHLRLGATLLAQGMRLMCQSRPADPSAPGRLVIEY